MSLQEGRDIDADGLTTQDLTINMGPQHPSTHGVLRVELVSDGEIIKAAYPHLGYLHRCFEKHAENLDYIAVVPFCDRMDYVASMNMELGFCLAIERLLEVEVPDRANAIRVMVLELNRIASHLLAYGTYGLDIGGFTPFLYAFRDREKVLSMFEELCGARLLYNYVRPGGVARDVNDSLLKKVEDFCDYFKGQLDELDRLLSGNAIFVNRTANVGVISQDLALSYGFSGPNLRGSGFNWDLRKEHPYCGYEKYHFDVCIAEAELGQVGDCWNRYKVRVKEMYQSLIIIRQALQKIAKFDDGIKGGISKTIKPKGEVYVSTECPRGELGFHLVADGSKKPYRLKVNSPCFNAISCLDEVAAGTMLADVVAIIGSLDIVLGEVDR